jgi:hypothetical protein
MSFVLQQLERQGLGWLIAARMAGDYATLRARQAELSAFDPIYLGAFADHLRRVEVGERVLVWANVSPPEDGLLVTGVRGLAFLQAVAIARIFAAPGATVRVDWNEQGLEICQVALGYGADSWQGRLSNRKGLVLADDAAKKVKGQGMVALQTLKMQEMERVLRGAGRQIHYADETSGDQEGAPRAALREVHP